MSMWKVGPFCPLTFISVERISKTKLKRKNTIRMVDEYRSKLLILVTVAHTWKIFIDRKMAFKNADTESTELCLE